VSPRASSIPARRFGLGYLPKCRLTLVRKLMNYLRRGLAKNSKAAFR